MSEADYAAFVEVIAAPAAPVPALVELSRRAPPWEQAQQAVDHGSNGVNSSQTNGSTGDNAR
ncbi:MAG: hypothetical protein Q4D19_08350 [Lautropia sp.]|nr:hypothetical protein [Lautropia sp.]